MKIIMHCLAFSRIDFIKMKFKHVVRFIEDIKFHDKKIYVKIQDHIVTLGINSKIKHNF